eukprot:Gb_33634 [translate_table: standard]
MIDIDLALAPFKPLAMQLLLCPFMSGLRFDEIAPLVKKLQPKVVMFPEALQKGLHEMVLNEQSILFYCKGQTLRVPSTKDEIELDMATDLAFQLKPKKVGRGKFTVAQLKAELHVQDSRLSLESVAPMTRAMSLSNQQCRWGVINPDVLLVALRDRGICAAIDEDVTSQILLKEREEGATSVTSFVVNIISPSKAIIEVRENHTLIKANDTTIRNHISEVVNSILSGI